jgi:predicted enzyme related to lactoylglutathione lyase
MLKRVHNAHYWTRQMDAGVAFYRDVLGLPLVARHGDDWAEFDVGGVRIALHGTREGHAPPTEGATVVFEVEDLDATIARLRERGVPLVGEVVDVPGTGRFVSFRDPDGNLLQALEPGSAAGGQG